MITLFAPKITPRLRYAADFLLTGILGVDVSYSPDSEAPVQEEGPCIWYAPAFTGKGLHIYPSDLLFERGISDRAVPVMTWQSSRALFPSPSHAAFPFDPFAAAFYLLSRYEEYLPHIRDPYQRFEAKESLAFHHQFLDQPVVDQWAMALAHALKQRYPELQIKPRKYRYLSTIDIDNAFAYKEKGIIRTTGGYLRSLLKGDLAEVGLRTKVLLGKQKDPYDTYAQQLDIQKKYGIRPLYFFLVADYGLNDKNVPIHNRNFQALIKFLADYADPGIHPSYGSNTRTQNLPVEIARLSHVLNREIGKSRQHFLKLNFPETYRNLIQADIKEDHTMGYASHIGFRAGTCTPFPFYDLEREEITELTVVPFQVMDATLRYYMKVSPQQVLDTVKPLIQRIRDVNGLFVSLWHNESLSENETWKGWNGVYEELVREAVSI